MRVLRSRGLRVRPQRRGRVPRPRPPRHLERQFGKAIVTLVRPAVVIARHYVAIHLSGIVALGPHKRMDADYGHRVKEVVNGMRLAYAERVPERDVTAVAAQAADADSDEQRDQWRTQAQEAIGVDPIRGEPWLGDVLKDATRQNVELIKTIPDRYFDALEQKIRAGVLAGKRHEELADDLRSDFFEEDSDEWQKMQNRAGLIARDQTMKFFGTLARVRQEDLGVVSYIWRTAQDERVRPEHAEREGDKFEWADAPEDGHPGMPINCRCVAEPVFEESDET